MGAEDTELTWRERQVVVLTALGYTAQQAAEVLDDGGGVAAMDQVRLNAKRKLGARTLSHLVHLAHEQGWPPLTPAELAWLAARINEKLGPSGSGS